MTSFIQNLVDLVFDLSARLGAEGRALLVVEQNATRMLGVSDRAYVLRSGEVLATDTGAELLADTKLFDTKLFDTKLFDTFVGPGPEPTT